MNTQQQYDRSLAVARRMAARLGIRNGDRLNLFDLLLRIEENPQFSVPTNAVGTYIPDGGSE